MERLAAEHAAAWDEPVAVTHAQLVRKLREFIAALDRRAPHLERAGEASIAGDAAVLRGKAVKRIAELETESDGRDDQDASLPTSRGN